MRFPELDTLDAHQRAAVLANARRNAAASRPYGMLAQIVVPLVVGMASAGAILLVFPTIATTVSGRVLLCVPAVLIAVFLYDYLRAKWIRPFIREELAVATAPGSVSKGPDR